MAERENQPTTADFPRKPVPHGETIAASSITLVEIPSDVETDRPVRGVSVIPIARREIARLEGTLRLNELPRHKPTIVFVTGRQFRDTVDE